MSMINVPLMWPHRSTNAGAGARAVPQVQLSIRNTAQGERTQFFLPYEQLHLTHQQLHLTVRNWNTQWPWDLHGERK